MQCQLTRPSDHGIITQNRSESNGFLASKNCRQFISGFANRSARGSSIWQVDKAMKTQAWGWLVAGVVALGLNGIYQDGGAAWAHQVVGRVIDRVEAQVGPALAMATGRADLFLARTKLAAAQQETSSCRVETAVARVQSRILRSENAPRHFEVMSARQEALMARLEANRARMESRLARMQFATVAYPSPVCPRVRVRVPRVSLPVLNLPAPVLDVDLASAGPI